MVRVLQEVPRLKGIKWRVQQPSMVLTLHPFEASKYLSHSSGYLHKYPSNWKRCRITTHGTSRIICQCTATTQGSKATTQGSKATTQGSKATTQGSYAFEFFQLLPLVSRRVTLVWADVRRGRGRRGRLKLASKCKYEVIYKQNVCVIMWFCYYCC